MDFFNLWALRAPRQPGPRSPGASRKCPRKCSAKGPLFLEQAHGHKVLRRAAPMGAATLLYVAFLQTLSVKHQNEPSLRGERTWAIAIQTVLREPKFRTEFPYFSREKRSEFRRKRDFYEPLPTAMAQVLPFLIFHLSRGHERAVL